MAAPATLERVHALSHQGIYSFARAINPAIHLSGTQGLTCPDPAMLSVYAGVYGLEVVMLLMHAAEIKLRHLRCGKRASWEFVAATSIRSKMQRMCGAVRRLHERQHIIHHRLAYIIDSHIVTYNGKIYDVRALVATWRIWLDSLLIILICDFAYICGTK